MAVKNKAEPLENNNLSKLLPRYKRIQTLEIKPYDKNSRKHSDQQIEQLCISITEFGFTNPLIVDKDLNLIAGHARLAAATKLGITEVPAIFLENLTDTQKRAYVIADNKLALNAEWDMGLLIEELHFINDAPDFNISLTGFSDEELDALLAPELEPFDYTDDVVPEAAKESRVKLGDLWQLGEHYLLCADSREQHQVQRLFDIGTPNIMITDPPYGVKLDMSRRGDEKRHKTNNTNLVANDDIADWYDTYILFPGNIVYVWHASLYTDVVMDGLRRAGFVPKQQIIWNKPSMILGRSNYHWKHEPCWFAIRKDCTHSWLGDRKQTTVWDIAVPNQTNNKSDDDRTEHPTQKPLDVYTKPIENHTKRNDYIYDPFGGSGTAIIAAQKTGRKALTVELDPKYCDIIIERWETLTNGKGINIVTD